MSVVQENLPLILGIALGALFVLGLVLGLRTENGRAGLAAAAVRLAVAALGFAERWLGRQVEPVTLENGRTVYGPTPVSQARTDLRRWLAEKPDEVERV
jgi:hypothetical protein